MTAIVLPDIDRSTIDELKKKIPNLSEFELPAMPSMEKVGKNADETIDRLLGRQKSPVWPWIAAGLGLVAVVGAVAAWFAWFRRPSWDSAGDTWSTVPESTDSTSSDAHDSSDPLAPSSTGGLTAAESSLSSTSSYPSEEA
jgi:hypothetical protein